MNQAYRGRRRTMLSMQAFVVIVLGLLTSRSGAAERPNLLFLLTDDQTAHAAGCYGDTSIRTPNIDALSARGVRFTNHYNTTSICMASRVSILTGLYEYRHGCNFQHGDLPRRFFAKSYPVLLRNAGYYTGFAGKIGFTLEDEPFEVLANEFDAWAGGPGQTFYETSKNPPIAKYADRFPHSSRAYAAWADDFLREAKKRGKRFCLSISFKAPHLPFTPDPQDLGTYVGMTFPRPENYGYANGQHLSPQSKTSRAAKQYREWLNDFDATLAKYNALITGVDTAIGMIRESLAAHGFAENTVIIFTSDNGYNRGAHGFGDKVLPYEEGSKSPLIIYDPRAAGTSKGRTSSALTANVDMCPTILDLAQIKVPDSLDGQSLVPLLSQPEARVRTHLPLFNFWGTQSAQSMAIVTERWKYIHWPYESADMRATEELFDLSQDRFEMTLVTDTSGEPTERLRMRQIYDRELEAIRQRAISGHNYEPYGERFRRR